MKRFLNHLAGWQFLTPAVLFCLCAGSVLFLLPNLGFYWDDWAIAWIYSKFGTAGLERYFSTNRVYWGRIFQLSASLVGSVPWRWHLYALVWHWIASLSLFWSMRRLLPDNRNAAIFTGCLFAVYPAYSMQSLAIFSAHFYIVLSAYLLSLGLMALAFRTTDWRRWLYTLLALLLALVNQVTTEYFFMLELLRPVLLWLLVFQVGDNHSWRERLKKTLISWLPYLVGFLAVVYWRMFIFSARPENFQSANYEMVFFTNLKEQPLTAVLELLARLFQDLWLVTGSAWGQAFLLPARSQFGARTMLVYCVLVVGSGILVFLAVKGWQSTSDQTRAKENWGWFAILAGAFALIMAGWPFWLTGLPVGLGFPNSRFTLPFLLGGSLLLAGILQQLPVKYSYRALLLSVLVGLAAGQSFKSANEYRRDWNVQKAFFWQMVWRMPQLEPGTTVLANDWQGRLYSDNSLTAPLNWIYENHDQTEHMSYMFFFPSVRLGYGLPSFDGGLPIEQDYLAASFTGSTSDMVALYFGSDACLRVLDPLTDVQHWSISPVMREAAAVSNTDVILSAEGEQSQLPVEIFGEEIAHGWCYYFEKAELARQNGDWQRVVELGEEAFKLDEHPNDPTERLVFIEGYAHRGDWQRSLQLTEEAGEITPLMQPLLCRLWQRIDEDTEENAWKRQTLQQVKSSLSCE